MRIDHLAIWVQDLEAMRQFYERYFGAKAGEKYRNESKQFESYFLSFDTGCRLELMVRPDIPAAVNDLLQEYRGLTHFAISLGSAAQVDVLTEQLRADGYAIGRQLYGHPWAGPDLPRVE